MTNTKELYAKYGLTEERIRQRETFLLSQVMSRLQLRLFIQQISLRALPLPLQNLTSLTDTLRLLSAIAVTQTPATQTELKLLSR